MQSIAQYSGTLLNHVEALYRPGDRDIVVELAEALGCVANDTGIESGTGSTFLAIHPNPADQDIDNNALYVSQITPEQEAVETALQAACRGDVALRQGLADYREKAHRWPFGIPHFGLRYRSEAQVEAVATRLGQASERLKDRVRLRIFRPGEEGSLTEFIQGFVHQDVIVSGSFMFGQLIELQYQPEPA